MAIDLSPILADLRHGRHAAAKAACLALLEAHGDDFGLHQVMAAIALAEERPDAAAASAARALALHPDHPAALLLAGKAARSLGRLPEALDLFRRAAVRAPDRGEPAFLACAVLLEQGDATALSLLDQLLGRFPDDGPGWAEIGRVLQEAGKPAAALVALDRALRLRPSAAIATRRGAVLQALGRPLEAIEALRSACVLAPQSPEALVRLAQALRRSGALAEARATLEAAAAIRRDGPVQFALGLVCQDLGDLTAAEAAYRAALAADPGLAEAAVNRGIVLQDMGRLEEAKRAYGQALCLRADSFGRIAQAMTTPQRGELWLDLAALRVALGHDGLA